ncbi:MAG: KH domain-containing protein [Candidatus Baldrarchaeia archaeon]
MTSAVYTKIEEKAIEKFKTLKEHIEEKMKVTLTLESSGIVRIETEDPYTAMKVKQIIEAISMSYGKLDILQMMDFDLVLQVIDVKELVGGGNKLKRTLGRLIGTKGKVKEAIENLTETKIKIDEEEGTVGILGRPENADIARIALLKIIRGKPQNKVIQELERKRIDIKMRKFDMWM